MSMLNLIGIILPVVIDFINGKITSQFARFAVSVLVCSVVGLGVNYIETNGFRGYILPMDYAEGISKSILVMFGIAQLVYQGLYKGTDLHDNVRANALG